MEKRVIPFSPPDISEWEIQEVVEALRSGWITTGPRTKLLERRLAAYIETGRVDVDVAAPAVSDKYQNRVVCLGSGTAAEELSLRVLGIGEGDEVVVSSYTYTSTAAAAIHCGAKVVFADIQRDGNPETRMPEMAYEAIERAITPRTKAVVTVDLGGVVSDYDRLFEVVEKKRNLFRPKEADGTPLGDLSARIQKALGRVAVVADSAHSLGASRIVCRTGTGSLPHPEWKACGQIADFTSFSFHAVKNFTTAEGGAATWLPIPGVPDAEIYKMFQVLSLHGQDKDALAKYNAGSWEYDVVGPWYKCNMTDIMAAIGLRQLDRYPGLIDRRRQMRARYDAVCEELGLFYMRHHTEHMESSHHLYLIRIPGIGEGGRNEFIRQMAKRGVTTNVHYKPLPLMTAYGKDCTSFPNAFAYYENLVTLPFHTRLSDADVEYVLAALWEVVGEFRAK